MKYWTWAEIKAKVRKELDLEAEVFIEESELLEYANEAIDEAEAEIHALYEDYFLTSASISLVANTEEYDLPSDIYAHKIRRIVYRNNSTVYEVERLRDWRKFEKKHVADVFSTSDLYTYFLRNTTPGSPKIIWVPKARETGPNAELWYIRNANRLLVDADVCDIPEFITFIFDYMRVRVYEKEGHPLLQQAEARLQRRRALMQGVLSNMIPDAMNEIEADMTMYEEME